ncbi:retrovirus-related pol polyprotein from transposon TNT 1-94 [Tanacetum coccineum]
MNEVVFVSQTRRICRSEASIACEMTQKVSMGTSKQAPRAWYDKLSAFLIKSGFTKRVCRSYSLHEKNRANIFSLVQIYVDDIIFALLTPEAANYLHCEMNSTFRCREGKQCSFFLVIAKFLKSQRHLYHQSKLCSGNLGKKASRPVMYCAVCLWYTKDLGLELKAFADADYAGCHDTGEVLSGSAQFLGHRLDAVLKSSGCVLNSETMDLRSTKFRCIVTIKVLLLYAVIVFNTRAPSTLISVTLQFKEQG